MSDKIKAQHLGRKAILHIRQSSAYQVSHNLESQRLQYAMQDRLQPLGWREVDVVDDDLGRSAARMVTRSGFQRMVAEVCLGQVGAVAAREVSRFARNSREWQQLVEVCRVVDTVLIDLDTVYCPRHSNDRLLLGLKGTMSEAELHVLRARLRGGILNKARRGALEVPLPIGFVYDGARRVVLDPDQQIQGTLRTFFATFARTGSATGTVQAFAAQHLRCPRRPRRGDGVVMWAPLAHSGALRILHNPRYAGAFVFGRTRQRHRPEAGPLAERLPREEWTVLIRDAHAGYITWDEFEAHQQRLHENAQAMGADRRRSPVREGPALLLGLVLCGRCGDRMTVRYHQRHGSLWPTYVCQRRGIAQGVPICQSIPGHGLDVAIGDLLCETVTPATIALTLEVQHELQARAEEADRLRRQHVERAQYEAELARRRYVRVDPEHRLVAAELEAAWNHALRAVTEAQEAYDRHQTSDGVAPDAEQQARLHHLVLDFPRLWHHANTPDRERKRMVRLLLEDVTLKKTPDALTAQVRFRGGATRSLQLSLALAAWQLRQTPPAVVAAIDQLLSDHTEGEIAAHLNAEGAVSGEGRAFSPALVARLRRTYHLRSRYDRLRDHGLLTVDEMANRLDVVPQTVKIWARHGLLRRHPCHENHDSLYEPPGPNAPVKMQGRRLSDRRCGDLLPDQTSEVQYGA